MNKWNLYELLKGNTREPSEIIKVINSMSIIDLREGVIEYLLARKREENGHS